MKIRKTLCSFIAACFLFSAGNASARNAMEASSDASQDIAHASLQLSSATANLSAATLHFSHDVTIGLGRTVSTTVLNAAQISGDAVVFSADVLADGLITTSQLSGDLTRAGISFSADSAALASAASHAGIHFSVDTAQVFLDRAVNIAAASGRLSGEAATLAVTLTKAGVEVSADSAILIANASKAGIELSEEAADHFIEQSLLIAADCIDSAIITERYIIMTLEEANRILEEVSTEAIHASLAAGKKLHTFTVTTTAHLKNLGIDANRYARELTHRATQSARTTATKTLKGADQAIVVVINTGSGLIVASIDSLTTAAENTTKNIK